MSEVPGKQLYTSVSLFTGVAGLDLALRRRGGDGSQPSAVGLVGIYVLDGHQFLIAGLASLVCALSQPCGFQCQFSTVHHYQCCEEFSSTVRQRYSKGYQRCSHGESMANCAHSWNQPSQAIWLQNHDGSACES